MKPSASGSCLQLPEEGVEKRCLNSELWHACAGPLVCLPNLGTRVVYFPQGHSEQVAASTSKEVEGPIPNYPSLPPQLICQLHDVTMHADVETDEVYAQMTLQPLSSQDQKDTCLGIDMGIASKQPSNYFCKTLTASDTSSHGGFSVPRRAAEKVFPPLDFSQVPPSQELVARDLHDVEWKFRHIFRGQPKRHLLTTGWSVFVSAKRLVAGDSIIFIWNEQNQLLLGIRRASRPQTVMPSSVLSSDSMHIGLLAAAAHAAATNSRFTVFYNPRASPYEFVISLVKYLKSVFHTCVSVGMRFRMLFETDESSVRRYMGTVTGVSDLDPQRWPNSHWRSVKVGWDESTAGERPPRVSLWEIEPLTTFPMYPSIFPLRLKRPWHPGVPSFPEDRDDYMWLRGNTGDPRFQSSNLQSLAATPWIQPSLEPLVVANEHDQFQIMAAAAFQDNRDAEHRKDQYVNFQQSFQFPQRGSHELQQEMLRHSQMQKIMDSQAQFLSERPTQHVHQELLQQHGSVQQLYQPILQNTTNAEPFQSSSNPMMMQHSPTPSMMSPLNFSSIAAPTGLSSVLGPACIQESTNILGYSGGNQHLMNERSTQKWAPKFAAAREGHLGNADPLSPFPGRSCSVITENCSAGSQNHTLFGFSIDSSLHPSVVPSSSSNVVLDDVSKEPYATVSAENSLYGYLDTASNQLYDGVTNSEAKTFVKVCKSGSVGRSLDISRFSNYDELRRELGQMFGIEGELEDPLRSGWQLVFVDREDDVLLLGDDPWE